MNKKFAIIEIGSNNTKTHIYENDNLVKENPLYGHMVCRCEKVSEAASKYGV